MDFMDSRSFSRHLLIKGLPRRFASGNRPGTLGHRTVGDEREPIRPEHAAVVADELMKRDVWWDVSLNYRLAVTKSFIYLQTSTIF
jgi:hypothetical protein